MKLGASFHAPLPICFVPAAAPHETQSPGCAHNRDGDHHGMRSTSGIAFDEPVLTTPNYPADRSRIASARIRGYA